MISDLFWCFGGMKWASCRVGRVTVICLMGLVWWASKQLYSYPANTCICWNRPQSVSETSVLALSHFSILHLRITQFRQQPMTSISRGGLGASIALGPDPWIIFLMENGHITCSSNCVTTIASRKASVLKQGKMFLWTFLLFRYWHDLGHWVWVQGPHSFDGNLTRYRYAWFTRSMHGLPGKSVPAVLHVFWWRILL